ncbi:MAG: energy-coupling factor transporter ATPase [Bacillaceae bacterium]|nr:energy-coupling factor transporter ATPase [Bacillaceae bacterium]
MVRKVIELSNLSFQYEPEAEEVLKDISLDVYQGEWISIVGHNGSGKSTLAKFLNALLIPEDEKKVCIEGLDTADSRNIWDVRKSVGMVFQNPDNQIVATTVKDDIAFGLENLGLNREDMKERIDYALSKVKMIEYLDAEPYRLSGGQKQRIAIASVLAMKPTVMIFDEATSMLDPMGRKEVLSALKTLNKVEGITIINITHDLEETLLSDRIIVMKEGRIILEGNPRQVFSKEREIMNAGLELPFAISVQNELNKSINGFEHFCLTEEELVNELWKLSLKT